MDLEDAAATWAHFQVLALKFGNSDLFLTISWINYTVENRIAKKIDFANFYV